MTGDQVVENDTIRRPILYNCGKRETREEISPTMDLKNNKEKLQQLANLMNEQSATPILMVTDDLLWVFDAALEPEEVDFLLKMGGGNLRHSEAEARVGLPKGEFHRMLTTLLDKGHITELEPEPGQAEPLLHLMCIFPGWFEHYLMGGKETPDRKEFARRVTKYFAMAQDIPPDVLNAILVGVGPQRSIATASPPTPRIVKVGKPLPPQVSEIYPPHSVLSILEKLPDDEVISVGHCFCRQQRKLDGDPCRMNLPEEACLGLGSAARHIIDRGMGRRISKQEAIKLVKESAAEGRHPPGGPAGAAEGLQGETRGGHHLQLLLGLLRGGGQLQPGQPALHAEVVLHLRDGRTATDATAAAPARSTVRSGPSPSTNPAWPGSTPRCAAAAGSAWCTARNRPSGSSPPSATSSCRCWSATSGASRSAGGKRCSNSELCTSGEGLEALLLTRGYGGVYGRSRSPVVVGGTRIQTRKVHTECSGSLNSSRDRVDRAKTTGCRSHLDLHHQVRCRAHGDYLPVQCH